MPSRRSVLATTAAAVTATGGCLYDHPDPTPTPGPNCDHASVSDLRIDRVETESGEQQYAVVAVTVAELPAPALVTEIQTCDGTEQVRRSLSETGTREFRFGPFGCLDGVRPRFGEC